LTPQGILISPFECCPDLFTHRKSISPCSPHFSGRRSGFVFFPLSLMLHSPNFPPKARMQLFSPRIYIQNTIFSPLGLDSHDPAFFKACGVISSFKVSAVAKLISVSGWRSILAGIKNEPCRKCYSIIVTRPFKRDLGIYRPLSSASLSLPFEIKTPLKMEDFLKELTPVPPLLFIILDRRSPPFAAVANDRSPREGGPKRSFLFSFLGPTTPFVRLSWISTDPRLNFSNFLSKKRAGHSVSDP